MRVLSIGPSIKNSKGGMSSVIKEIQEDKDLCEKDNIDFYDSYIDGNKIKVIIFSIYALVKFIITGKAKKYDIFHIHMASYGSTFRKMMYAKIIKHYNKKLIIHIHSGEYIKFFNNLSEKNQKSVSNFLNSADLVITLSNEWKNKIESTINISNCKSLKNGINMDKFSSAINNVEDFSCSLLDLSKLNENKGTYDLINAINIVKNTIPNIKVYLAGNGEIEKAKEIIKEKELEKNIKLLGWIDVNEKIDILNKVSIVILPSHYEGLPMCILEGMACGKAIISTNVGAIPEVVTKDNGILVNPGDVNTLANAIINLCTDANMLKSMSNNNLEKIKENYDLHIMHNKLAKFYESI